MRWRESLVTASILAVLLLLISTIAFLQVRSITRLGDWERDRLTNGLRADAERFTAEFDGWVSLIYKSYRIAPGIYDEKTLARELSVGTEAVAGSGLAGLVNEVYAVTADRAGAEIRRLDAAAGTLARVAWPEALGAARDRIVRLLSDGSDRPTGMPFAFIDRLPGLVVEQNAFFRDPRRPGERAVWVIVTLDREALLGRWVPALVESVFSRGDPPEFDVAIVEQSAPDELLYATDPSADAAVFGRPVVTLDFFAYSEPARARWPARLVLRDGRDDEPVGTVEPPAERLPLSPDDGRLAGALAGLSPEGGWRLLVAWRPGSLEGAVARMQGTNIAVGLGIVALLGVAVALVALSSRRARELAAQRLAFVGGITHDFRTPLAVIRTGAENLARGVVRGRREVERYAGILLEEERKLTDMVEQALKFSGVRFPRRSLRKEACDARELVEGAILGCRPLLRRNRAALRASFPRQRCTVRVDRPLVEAAIGHLIVNAVKYGGSTRKVEVTMGVPAGASLRSVSVSVRDHGIGILPADRGRIFEPFHRGANARQAGIPGSGLGLAFVRGVARAHRGRVTFRGEPGRGTTFTITLPAGGARGESLR